MRTRFIHEAGHDIPQGSFVTIRKGDGKLVIAAYGDKKIGYATELLKEGKRVIIENGVARVAKDGEL